MLINFLPVAALAFMMLLSSIHGSSGISRAWALLYRFVNEPSSRQERNARISLIVVLTIVATYHLRAFGSLVLTFHRCASRKETSRPLHDDDDYNDASRFSGPSLLGELPSQSHKRPPRKRVKRAKLTRKERAAERARRVTPNDFVHGKGRGFLFVADGTDLVRAVSAAKALRTYASSSSFAAGVVGNGPGGVSITLLTDAFGVRSFLPPQPGAKAFQAHLNTNKKKEGGHNHDPTHREENEKSQRRRRQHQRKGNHSSGIRVPHSPPPPPSFSSSPLFDPFDHVWDIRWIVANGRRHSFGSRRKQKKSRHFKEHFKGDTEDTAGEDDDDDNDDGDDDDDIDHDDGDRSGGGGGAGDGKHGKARRAGQSGNRTFPPPSPPSQHKQQPHQPQFLSWAGLRLYALAHLSPYQETVFLGPDTVLCSPLVFGLFDLLRRWPVVGTPPAHFVGSGAGAAGGAGGGGGEGVEGIEAGGGEEGEERGGEEGGGGSVSSGVGSSGVGSGSGAGSTGDHHLITRHDLSLDLASGALPRLAKATGAPNVLRPLGLGLVAFKQSDAARACFRRLLDFHLSAAKEKRDQASLLILKALDLTSSSSSNDQETGSDAAVGVDDGSLFAHAAFLTPHLPLYVLPQEWNCRAEFALPTQPFSQHSGGGCLAFHAPNSVRNSNPAIANAIKRCFPLKLKATSSPSSFLSPQSAAAGGTGWLPASALLGTSHQSNPAVRRGALAALGVVSPLGAGDDDALGEGVRAEKALRFERKRTASKAKAWSEEWDAGTSPSS